MKKHLFVIGSIASLNIKKDSSLLLASALQDKGAEVYLVEEKNFFITPGTNQLSLYVHPFTSSLKEDEFYMDTFELAASTQQVLSSDWILHMRCDPPVDQRYTRYLWMLTYLQDQGIRVTNNPRGIIQTNEKLVPYEFNMPVVSSFYGEASHGLRDFLKSQVEKDIKELIIKPMDSFSGIGVEKVNLAELGIEKIFQIVRMRDEAVIVQPFLEKVYEGEQRSLYLGGKLIGAIDKRPKDGSYLANIAQGAQFKKLDLSSQLQKNCEEVANKLLKIGIDFIAFDLLDGCITEVNVTCPGLVNEVSTAEGKNLAIDYAEYFLS